MCSARSNMRFSLASSPSSSCAMARWPELETGSHSVTPCMMPRTTAVSASMHVAEPRVPYSTLRAPRRWVSELNLKGKRIYAPELVA